MRNRMPAAARRQQLSETAAQQFHHLGYHGVTIADVATSVGLTVPAVYRHFANKQALLAAAIDSGLDRVEAVMVESPHASWEERLDGLAAAAVDRRDLWMLLQREMRNLEDADRLPLERRFAAFSTGLRDELVRERPDLDPGEAALIVTAVLAVFSSQSTYPAPRSGVDRKGVLARLAGSVAAADLSPSSATAAGDPPTSVSCAPAPNTDGAESLPALTRDEARSQRSEALLSTSIRLFHELGYAAVSLDDIGAEVGMAGPSIYHHFATKAGLLVGAFARATDWLAHRRDQPGGGSIDDLVRAYVDLGVRERMLLGVYVLEAVSLPPQDARQIRVALEIDVDAWSTALQEARPTLTEDDGALVVHAARAVVHDVVRVGHFHDRPAIASELEALVHAALNVDLPSQTGS